MRTIDRNSFILLTIIGAIYFSFTFSESKIKETDSKSFNKLIDLKDEKLTLLGGICEGHIISANALKKYTKIGNKPYTHITKLHYGLYQVLNTIRKGMAYDLTRTIKQANKGE